MKNNEIEPEHMAWAAVAVIAIGAAIYIGATSGDSNSKNQLWIENGGWIRFSSITSRAKHEPYQEAWCRVVDIQVKDADTINADIILPYGVILGNQDIRACDYDAWESSKRRPSREITDEEVVLGKKATEEFEKWISKGVLFVSPGEGQEQRDNYGRILAKWKLIRNGEEFLVRDWMKENGHLREGEKVNADY